MGYLGGKYKIRYQVSEYINALSPKTYLEPFCGYAWVGERVRAKHRFFSDLNQDLILMWQGLLKGWKPPEHVSEELYLSLRHAEPSALRGFAGTACAFGCVWFGGYARDPKNPKNFARTGSRQLVRRINSMRHNSEFHYRGYIEAMDAVKADVIYLDPPYANTSEYKGAGERFDSDAFWEEVRRRSDGRRRILVSEYAAPADFSIVLKAQSRMGLRVGTGTDLQHDLRDEILVEFNPPKRSRITFTSLFD